MQDNTYSIGLQRWYIPAMSSRFPSAPLLVMSLF